MKKIIKNLVFVLSLSYGQGLCSAQLDSFSISEMQDLLKDLLEARPINIECTFEVLGWDIKDLSLENPKLDLENIVNYILKADSIAPKLLTDLEHIVSDYKLNTDFFLKIMEAKSKEPIGFFMEEPCPNWELIGPKEPWGEHDTWSDNEAEYPFFQPTESLLEQSRKLLTDGIFSINEIAYIITELREYKGKDFYEILTNAFNAAVLVLVQKKVILPKDAFHYFSQAISADQEKYQAIEILTGYFDYHLFSPLSLADDLMNAFARAESMSNFLSTESGMENYRLETYFVSLASNIPLQRTSVRRFAQSNIFHAEQETDVLSASVELLKNGNYSVDNLIPLIDRIYSQQGPIELALQNLVNATVLQLMSLHDLSPSNAYGLFIGVLAKNPLDLANFKDYCDLSLFAGYPEDLEKFLNLFNRLGPQGHMVQVFRPWDRWPHHPSTLEYFSEICRNDPFYSKFAYCQ